MPTRPHNGGGAARRTHTQNTKKPRKRPYNGISEAFRWYEPLGPVPEVTAADQEDESFAAHAAIVADAAADCKRGKRAITEVKAPAGYTLLTEPLFTGTLDSSNRDVTITACNNAGFALPFTGGTGFTTYFLFAALMLCMGVYFCKRSNIKKETTK